MRSLLLVCLACGAPPAEPDSGVRAVECGDAEVREGLGCVVLGGSLRAPRDVWVLDGAIYVSEFGNDRIVRLEGGAWSVVADGLRGPIGLRAIGERLVVGEEHARSVSWIDPASGVREPIAEELHNVTYVALAPGGALWVSSFETTAPVGSGIVWRVDPDGTSAPFATGLHVPEGLFAEDDGSLVVAEWALPSAIVRFPPDGGAVSARIAEGFENVYGLCGDGAGGFFVGDHAGRVVHVRIDGSREVLIDRIGRPGGITRHPDGDLLVVEFVDFGAEGRLLRLSGVGE